MDFLLPLKWLILHQDQIVQCKTLLSMDVGLLALMLRLGWYVDGFASKNSSCEYWDWSLEREVYEHYCYLYANVSNTYDRKGTITGEKDCFEKKFYVKSILVNTEFLGLLKKMKYKLVTNVLFQEYHFYVDFIIHWTNINSLGGKNNSVKHHKKIIIFWKSN